MSVAIVDATHRTVDDAADGISRSRYTMPIGNLPLISHVIGDLAAGGVRHARVVAAGEERAGLEQVLGGEAVDGLAIEVVAAPERAPRQGVLAELDAAIGAEPVVLAPGDGLCPGLLHEMRSRYGNGDVDLVLSAGEDTEVGADPRRRRLSTSPVVLGPRTRGLVSGLLAPDREDASLTETLLGGNLRVAVCDARGHWSYESSTEALLAGNRRVLDRLPHELTHAAIAEDNELHGRIRIGEGVVASGSVIHGPVAIADHVVLEDCHIGPFTAIGPHAVLRGAEIDDSIVLAGAEVRHPDRRITASIIGEHARVERSFTLPRGVQLRLGPHSRLGLH